MSNLYTTNDLFFLNYNKLMYLNLKFGIFSILNNLLLVIFIFKVRFLFNYDKQIFKVFQLQKEIFVIFTSLAYIWLS